MYERKVLSLQQIIMFCIPYAGSSAAFYNSWSKTVEPFIKIHPLELAGRGKRSNEAFYENMEEAVEDLYKIINPYITSKTRYAIYGHSLGGLLAYNLTKKIQKVNSNLPVQLFLSGRGAPHIKKREIVYHDLPLDQLLDTIEKLGGTPKSILNNRDFQEYYIPIIRADFKLIDTYEIEEKRIKLDTNISVFCGENDDITYDEMIGWKEYTCETCNLYWFNGNHFFLHECKDEVINNINNQLKVSLLR